MEVAEKLFQEIAKEKATTGDAIVSYDANGQICAIETTEQLERQVRLQLGPSLWAFHP